MNIKVHMAWYSDRQRFVLRWVDANGRKRHKSTSANREEGEAHAKRLEATLNSACPWDEFCFHWDHRDEWNYGHPNHLQDRYRKAVNKAIEKFAQFAQPQTTLDVTQEKCEAWLEHESLALAEGSIKHLYQHFNAALRWGKEHGYVANVPKYKGAGFKRTADTAWERGELVI